MIPLQIRRVHKSRSVTAGRRRLERLGDPAVEPEERDRYPPRSASSASSAGETKVQNGAVPNLLVREKFEKFDLGEESEEPDFQRAKYLCAEVDALQEQLKNLSECSRALNQIQNGIIKNAELAFQIDAQNSPRVLRWQNSESGGDGIEEDLREDGDNDALEGADEILEGTKRTHLNREQHKQYWRSAQTMASKEESILSSHVFPGHKGRLHNGSAASLLNASGTFVPEEAPKEDHSIFAW